MFTRIVESAGYAAVVGRARRRETLIFSAVIVLAVLLRLYLILSTAYIWDEDHEHILNAQSISLNPSSLNLPIRCQLHAALDLYFIAAGSALLGENPLGFRFFSLIAGILTILAAYRLVYKSYGGAAAGWAAALFAFNEYFIGVSAFAIETPYYLCFAMLALAAFDSFLKESRAARLYAAGAFSGLAFLTHEIAVFLLLAFALVLLTQPSKRWFLRKEPYIALLVFITVILPDLVWNLFQPRSDLSAGYLDHLSRIRPAISIQPLIFYGHDALRSLHAAIGRPFFDAVGEYPAMNALWGALLLTSVALMTIRRNKDDTDRLLLLLFWPLVIFFTFIRSASPRFDSQVWFWTDLAGLAAVPLAARVLAELKGWLRPAAYAVSGNAMLLAVSSTFGARLGLPDTKIAFVPDFVVAGSVGPTPVEVKFQACELCQKNPVTQLIAASFDGPYGSEANTAEWIQEIRLGNHDRDFRVLAPRVPSHFKFTYKITSRRAGSTLVQGTLPVLASSPSTYLPMFWTLDKPLRLLASCPAR